MSTKILVTGATGDVGVHLLEELVKKDSVVVYGAICAEDKESKKLEIKGIEYVVVDYNNVKETFGRVLEDMDTLFLDTSGSSKMPEYVKEIIDEAKQAGIKDIVYHDETTDSSQEIKDYIIKSGIPYTIIQSNGFMQDYAHLLSDTMKATGNIAIPVGKSKINPVDIRDTGSVLAEALTKVEYRNEAYTLTGNDPLSFDDLAQVFSAALGKKINYTDVTEEQYSDLASEAGLSSSLIKDNLGKFKSIRDGHLALLTGDVEKFLGREPNPFKVFAIEFAHDSRGTDPK